MTFAEALAAIIDGNAERDKDKVVRARQDKLDSDYAAAQKPTPTTPGYAEMVGDLAEENFGVALDRAIAAGTAPRPDVRDIVASATPAPAGEAEPETPEDTGFAAAIEAALSRTRDVTERAKATVATSGAATDAQARMEKIGQEAASSQRTAAVENAAKKGFEAAGSPLESPAEVANAAAEKRFSEAEAEVAFRTPAAPVVPEVDEATVLKDFETTHGGTFDPNSSADADKMERIKKARALNPKVTPTQLALMIYRNQV